jgi:hypothetical protein
MTPSRFSLAAGIILALAVAGPLCAAPIVPAPPPAGGGGSGTVTSVVAGTGLTGGTITATGTIALANPSASTLGGIESLAATTHQFINAISTLGVPTAAQPACADISDAGGGCTLATNGSGNLVRVTGATLVTPTLGAATATSINGDALTTGTWTLNGAAGKTLLFNNSITLAGTDAQTYTFPTTTATLARTDAGQTFTGTQAFGVVTGTTWNGWTLNSATVSLTGTTGQTYTLPTTTATIARTDTGQTFSGTQNMAAVNATGAAAVQISTVTIAGSATPTCSATTGSPTCAVNAHSGTVGIKMTLGAAGTATTMTITPGITAANGWVCEAHDLTTTTERLFMTANSATVATLTFTNAAGTATPPGATDVIWGSCWAL